MILLQRLLAPVARCHDTLRHLLRVLTGNTHHLCQSFVLFKKLALLSWNRLLYWFSSERLHRISFPAREKRDCKSYAAVPSENLHQVRFYWIFIIRSTYHLFSNEKMLTGSIPYWCCKSLRIIPRFRPKTSERAYIHIMKVARTKITPFNSHQPFHRWIS